MMSKVYYHVLVIISLLFGIIPYALAAECDTLTSFYNSIKGPLLEDFKVYSDCCNMLGVTCESGQVTEIEVSNTSNSDADFKSAISVATGFANLKKLTITKTKSKDGIVLPNNIGNFKKITSLIISNNSSENKDGDSTSTIPESIGDLKTLEILDLSDNGLAGSIPKSMKNLINLTNLDLSGNNLSGTVPYDMKDLKNLEKIELGNNENLKGYAPLFENARTCSYSGTNLCQLKSNDCAYGISGCTIQEIQMTNKENGAPSVSTYESEVSTNKISKKAKTGGGVGVFTFLLIVGYVWYKCGCCCCHSSSTRVYTIEEKPVVSETPSINVSVNNTVSPPAAYIPPPVNNTIIYGNVNNGNINSNNNGDPNPPPYVDPNVSAYGTNYPPQFVPAPAPYGSYPPPNVPSAPSAPPQKY